MDSNCPKEHEQSLRKAERISLKRTIDLLYTKGQSIRAFPIKLIYHSHETTERPAVGILTAVSKKNLRRACARNYVKRRIRESYRRRKHEICEAVGAGNRSLSIAFMYLHKEKLPFRTIDAAIAKALAALIRKL
jgi:ribonuclease P protein component